MLSVSEVMSVPGYEVGQRLAEEQDYVQAYENVREKYKGKERDLSCTLHTHICTPPGDNHVTAE